MKRLCFLLLLVSCQVVPPLVEVETVEPVADTLSYWQKLQMAIIMTESRFNPDAVGKTNDYGVFQITPIYVREVNRLAGTEYSHEDAFDIDKSMEMFRIMQEKHNPNKDINKALTLHNKGSFYPRVVMQNLELIERMEEVRKHIKNYE